MKNAAFTLAEVLLTLAVIGVVASLTIPAVITKVTNDQTVVALKKAHNTLKSIERQAIQENGYMENWNWSSDGVTTFTTYFKPYFDILKDCGSGWDSECFGSRYEWLNGSSPGSPNTTGVYRIVAADGISYAYTKSISALPDSQAEILVDLNGKKEPNKYGKDTFAFSVFPSIGIKPRGAYSGYFDGTVDTIIPSSTASINYGCSGPSSFGSSCAARVLSEGAINY